MRLSYLFPCLLSIFFSLLFQSDVWLFFTYIFVDLPIYKIARMYRHHNSPSKDSRVSLTFLQPYFDSQRKKKKEKKNFWVHVLNFTFSLRNPTSLSVNDGDTLSLSITNQARNRELFRSGHFIVITSGAQCTASTGEVGHEFFTQLANFDFNFV